MLNVSDIIVCGHSHCGAIGGGANDRSMFAHASIKIAFCAKDILKKEANVIIDKKDLREVLTAI